MTHMHIPDGVLPVWLWIAGIIIMTGMLAFSVSRLKTSDLKKKIPLLGAVSAVMLVAMSLEILPIAYHINLSVIAGILLGPWLGFLAAFITNLMLALIGHGGITVLGLNTLLLGTEAMLGHSLFFFLFKRKLPVFWRSFFSTVLTLCVATLLLIGIVYVSHIDPELAAHHEEAHEAAGAITMTRFAILVLSLGLIGWIIEGFITGVVVRFLAQVKPDLLAHALHKDDLEAGARRDA